MVGDSGAGALRQDLHDAWTEALKTPRSRARARAMAVGWQGVAQRVVALLAVPPQPEPAPQRFRTGSTVPTDWVLHR